MSESIRFVDLIQSRLDGFFDARASILISIADELSPIAEFSRDFLSGGKRFRALFCFWGWQAVSASGEDAADGTVKAGGPLDAVVSVASALELFHAAALVHDDLIDNSDTRRGAPSAHRRFESLHDSEGWSGSGERFGTGAATLLGDLLLILSDELFEEGIGQTVSPAARRAARAEFNRMRLDVTAGQYLDLFEEIGWAGRPDADQLARAERVIVYKSAKYSIESPLLIGASLAGASAGQLDALRGFGLPLGIAYQLRDDLLGVFGDAAVTGKPSGDDLREGKRTVLIALTREALPAGARATLDELLGDPDLTAGQIETLQLTIRQSGAVEKVERMIADSVGRAIAALETAPIGESAKAQLRALAVTVTRRAA
ncbi:geranylgeranyl pyrophosphate synthase [Leifsonia xyli subsp. cynodontis DSM 46306]|uniref:Geranylgeranyl pyrophosphate synthase n=1 Tax=Leifsonia xyli subsp. cynodontis DSM 46306 TaxID=1389489 RepID=U3P892_LEIXC|nr:polyprenyl synthetase family protein [Leifsonia xyli]AGW41689.1 geranylgeranyl pyrophosphate synthase [Leifsonia xyli subsp. cynodontis DSM 46306]